MDKKDEYVEEVLEKEITQEAKVEPVIKSLGDMGTLYKAITQKLVKDGICYISKRKLEENEPFDIIKVPDEKVDKGMIAFVCVARSENTDG